MSEYWILAIPGAFLILLLATILWQGIRQRQLLIKERKAFEEEQKRLLNSSLLTALVKTAKDNIPKDKLESYLADVLAEAGKYQVEKYQSEVDTLTEQANRDMERYRKEIERYEDEVKQYAENVRLYALKQENTDPLSKEKDK